jgi:hypothetical protein
MVKKTLQNNVKLCIYFTPFQHLDNFLYVISKEQHLEIESYTK